MGDFGAVVGAEYILVRVLVGGWEPDFSTLSLGGRDLTILEMALPASL